MNHLENVVNLSFVDRSDFVLKIKGFFKVLIKGWYFAPWVLIRILSTGEWEWIIVFTVCFLFLSLWGGSPLDGSSAKDVWLDVFSSSTDISVGVGLSDFKTETFERRIISLRRGNLGSTSSVSPRASISLLRPRYLKSFPMFVSGSKTANVKSRLKNSRNSLQRHKFIIFTIICILYFTDKQKRGTYTFSRNTPSWGAEWFSRILVKIKKGKLKIPAFLLWIKIYYFFQELTWQLKSI